MQRPPLVRQRLGFGTALFAALTMFAARASADRSRTHDGLYVRLGGGVGYASDSWEFGPVAGVKTDATAGGLAGASEIAVGWSIADGFVVGGGLYSALLVSRKSTGVQVTVPLLGAATAGEVQFDGAPFHVVGPFVDYYFDAEEGLHVQGGLGLALLSSADLHTNPGGALDVAYPAAGGSGFGLMLGAGDEWWVSDGFSLGVVARVTMGFMSGDDSNGFQWHHSVFVPAALFVATLN